MTRNNKTLLATAVMGALWASSAFAQVNLSANEATSASLTFAAEQNKPAALTLTAASLDDEADVRWNLGYNFSDGEVRFGRFECANATFSVQGVTSSEVVANVSVGAVNQAGNGAVFFSITDQSTVAGAQATADDVFTANMATWSLQNNSDVTCTFGLYNTPADAQLGGTGGRIVSVTRRVFRTASSFVFTADAANAVANVEAANVYAQFVPGGNTIAGSAALGTFNFALAADPTLLASGATTTLADVFAANTAITFAGDTSAASNITHVPTGDNCGANVNVFDSITRANPGSASEPINDAAITRRICFAVGNSTPIPEFTGYTLTLNPITETGFTVAPITRTLGNITRNGTQLIVPLAQVPTGWISRLVFHNTGSGDRTYTATFIPAQGGSLSEGNAVYTGPTTATGTIPRNGTTVVRISDLFPTAGFENGQNTRGTILVTANAPTGQITAMYQIVNATSGSISNTLVLRPGTPGAQN